MADLIGQQLGNYRLIRLLGQGGFAEVYLGEHLRLGTLAAVKVLHTRILESDEVERFQQEARTIAHKDKPLLTQDIQQALPGATVDNNNANGDANLQQTQAQEDLMNGDCILVVGASDSQKAAATIAAAKAKGVPVIAYDRFIFSNDLNYYVSFDSTKVGQLQGEYIANHYQRYVQGNNKNVVMINGAMTDNNALLFAQGAHNALDPLFNSGTPIPSVLETPVAVDKSNIAQTVIADGWVTTTEVCSGLPSGTGGICP